MLASGKGGTVLPLTFPVCPDFSRGGYVVASHRDFNDGELLFMCILSICLFSLVKMSFEIFCPF